MSAVRLLGLAFGIAASAESYASESFTTIAPCRVVDTRLAGGPLAAGEIRNFSVTGDLASQGGNPAGCGIPTNTYTFLQASYPTAVMLNLVAVEAQGPGDLRAWAFSDPPIGPPLASALNYAAVPGLNLANGIVIPICQGKDAWSPVRTCASDIRVQAEGNATHLVIDVAGYFSPSGVTPMSSTTSTDVTLSPGDCLFLGLSLPAGSYEPFFRYFPPPVATLPLRADALVDASVPPAGTLEFFFIPSFSPSPCQGIPAARYANPQATPTRVYVPIKKELSYTQMMRGFGLPLTLALAARYTGSGQSVISAPSTLQGLLIQ